MSRTAPCPASRASIPCSPRRRAPPPPCGAGPRPCRRMRYKPCAPRPLRARAFPPRRRRPPALPPWPRFRRADRPSRRPARCACAQDARSANSRSSIFSALRGALPRSRKAGFDLGCRLARLHPCPFQRAERRVEPPARLVLEPFERPGGRVERALAAALARKLPERALQGLGEPLAVHQQARRSSARVFSSPGLGSSASSSLSAWRRNSSSVRARASRSADFRMRLELFAPGVPGPGQIRPIGCRRRRSRRAPGGGSRGRAIRAGQTAPRSRPASRPPGATGRC